MADKKWILPAADTSGPIQDGSTNMVLSVNENKEVELKAKKLNKRQIWKQCCLSQITSFDKWNF